MFLFRKYVPEVRNLPDQYIFEPWLAPIDVQEKAGCIVGKDYPIYIIEAEAARKICSEKMREVFTDLACKGT